MFVNFAASVGRALAGRRMARQDRPESVRLTLTDLIQNLEHLDHPAGVVAGALNVIEAQVIGFALGVAAVVHQETPGRQVAKRSPIIRAFLSAENRAQNRYPQHTHLHPLRAFDVLQPVTPDDVTYFVPHDAGQLSFTVRRREQSSVDVYAPAERRKSVD